MSIKKRQTSIATYDDAQSTAVYIRMLHPKLTEACAQWESKEVCTRKYCVVNAHFTLASLSVERRNILFRIRDKIHRLSQLITFSDQNRQDFCVRNYAVAVHITLMYYYSPLLLAEYCDQKDLYLRLGSKGLVSCDFGTFRVIGWLVGEHVDDRSPFIYVENSRIQGPGYENGEYDMFQNGSLIINKVSLQHEQMLTARIVKGLDVEHYTIEVKVYVLPVPLYPVVNGLTNQQHVVIKDYSGGQVNCTMDRVRPNIELELVFLDHDPQDVSLSSVHSSVNNLDGTYNVSLVSTITVGSNLTGSLRLQCRVAGQMAYYFPSVTLIDVLLLSTNFPEVNGSNGEQHVFRYVEREVYLTCSMDKALPNVSLEWVIVTPALSNQMLQEQTSTPPKDQVDGAVHINRNIWFRIPTDAIYAHLECRLWIGRDNVRTTTVELIIKGKLPSVLCQTKILILEQICLPNPHFSLKVNIYMVK
ncbi:hypothetical protein BSL78_23276 [Apostichopus japonicus]|uniref:Ig-like domain-containing protein n=1 Tax=Stichopus japonicus TaxID=307972 RepID=A0A2G8JVV4_STIJA|nr:hypothetical protein BSL78_23276 [Apostichopus japonicus]